MADSKNQPERLWWLEGYVTHTDGRVTIERAERNNPHGRRIMDGWAFRRVLADDVQGVEVRPVADLTRERSAGYLSKSERPAEVIGLKGGDA